jgi:phosphoenolpyruvate synthase/pyruvate phosphate dikinase
MVDFASAGPDAGRVEVPWLGDAAAHSRELVGGKAAQLSRLAARFDVPAGFCLPAGAPPAAAAAPYRKLGAQLGDPAPAVAVRSSAVDEDGHAASFAGQHATFLHVRGEQALLEAVRACSSSAHAESALAYRRSQGLGEAVPCAVLVQVLIRADVALVAFTADPVTGERDRVVVNAAWGLGESLVGGTVTPDAFVLHRDGPELLDSAIAVKRRMTVTIGEGTREVDVPSALRALPCLDESQALETARLALAVEAEMGHPVDIEAAWAEGRLHLLQCRPITTLKQ